MTYAVNLIVALFFGPLLAGIVRKHVRARLHSREGPPIWQPFYDLLKLLGKDDLRSSNSAVVEYAPIVVLGATLTTALLTPMGTQPPLSEHGDLIVFVHMITLSVVATILVGLSSPSPFSLMGAARETMLHIVTEPVLIICLVTAAVNAQSIVIWTMAEQNLQSGMPPSMIVAAIALLIALQAQIGKIPFDIADAETEIMGGPFVEISGPRLALFQWATMAKQMVYASILVAVFLPWGNQLAYPLSLLIHMLKVCAIVGIVGLIDVVNPRLRVEQAMKFFVFVIALALIGLGLAVVGF